MRRRGWLVAFCCGALGAAAGLAAPPADAAATPAEMQRIERLLQALAAEGRMRFERNGTRYAADEAARFLRAKWKARGTSVRTAEEFIERVASGSSTSGKPYLVCPPEAACMPAAGWLRALLQRVDSTPPGG